MWRFIQTALFHAYMYQVYIHVTYMGITEYKIMDLNVHNHVLHFQYVPKHDSTLEFVSSTVDLATTMHCKYI